MADPGFAKFINVEALSKLDEHPKEKISGGTWTYGNYEPIISFISLG